MGIDVEGDEGNEAAEMEALLARELDGPEAPVEEAPEVEVEAPEEVEAKPAIDRARDEQGRFAKQEAPVAAPAPENAPEASAAPAKSYSAPPGWSVAAKSAFAALPPAVQEAVARREEEVSQGFARYEGLAKYADICTKNGTTLASAVKDYAEVEDGLRANFGQGIEGLCQRFGVNPAELGAYLTQRYSVQPQQNAPQAQQNAPQQQFDPRQIEDRIMSRLQEQREQTEVNSEIANFRADPANKFFENVRPFMVGLLQSGQASNLKDAYEAACWAHPEVRAELMKEQASAATQAQSLAQKAQAAAQARKAAKSVTGSPLPNAQPSRSQAPSADDYSGLIADLSAGWDEQIGRA